MINRKFTTAEGPYVEREHVKLCGKISCREMRMVCCEPMAEYMHRRKDRQK